MYEYSYFFLVYSFLGWVAETVYFAVCFGKFLNRGFLNGPICPIYGFGAVAVLICLKPAGSNFAVIFLLSALLTTLLEFITGYVMEKIFKNKWWDYSDVPFNIMGYVCLKNSIMWGILCTLLIRVIHPPVALLINLIPHTAGVIILAVLGIIFICDAVFTIISLFSFKKRLRIIESISTEIRRLSDIMAEKIFDGVTEFNKTAAKKKEEYEEKLRTLITEKHFSHQRFIKAFPSISSKRFGKALEKLKKHINKH